MAWHYLRAGGGYQVGYFDNAPTGRAFVGIATMMTASEAHRALEALNATKPPPPVPPLPNPFGPTGYQAMKVAAAPIRRPATIKVIR